MLFTAEYLGQQPFSIVIYQKMGRLKCLTALSRCVSQRYKIHSPKRGLYFLSVLLIEKLEPQIPLCGFAVALACNYRGRAPQQSKL